MPTGESQFNTFLNDAYELNYSDVSGFTWSPPINDQNAVIDANTVFKKSIFNHDGVIFSSESWKEIKKYISNSQLIWGDDNDKIMFGDYFRNAGVIEKYTGSNGETVQLLVDFLADTGFIRDGNKVYLMEFDSSTNGHMKQSGIVWGGTPGQSEKTETNYNLFSRAPGLFHVHDTDHHKASDPAWLGFFHYIYGHPIAIRKIDDNNYNVYIELTKGEVKEHAPSDTGMVGSDTSITYLKMQWFYWGVKDTSFYRELRCTIKNGKAVCTHAVDVNKIPAA